MQMLQTFLHRSGRSPLTTTPRDKHSVSRIVSTWQVWGGQIPYNPTLWMHTYSNGDQQVFTYAVDSLIDSGWGWSQCFFNPFWISPYWEENDRIEDQSSYECCFLCGCKASCGRLDSHTQMSWIADWNAPKKRSSCVEDDRRWTRWTLLESCRHAFNHFKWLDQLSQTHAGNLEDANMLARVSECQPVTRHAHG